MNKHAIWVALVAVVIAGAGGAWYFLRQQPIEPTAESTDVASSSASTQTIQYPLVGADESAPVIDVDDTDEAIGSSLEKLFGTADLAQVLIPTQIVRHIVVSVDNLPRAKIALQVRPLHVTPGQFAIANSGSDMVISDVNYARYARVMHVVQVADIAPVADWYRAHYSLFQQAYQSLGYPQGYFNDRLVQAIDDLLATPELTTPVRLVQPKVFYEFADPELESRSAGQKTLLRMGPDNIKLIKQKLRELRADITKPSP